MTLEEHIKRYDDRAKSIRNAIVEKKESQEVVELLRELKAYREQSAGQKCSVCKYQDSDYYCDHCMRTYDDKFEEVKADDR